MKHIKNYKLALGFGKVGRNAYEVSKVWNIGLHAFTTNDDYIFRICYLRTSKATHYWQISIGKRHNDYCGNKAGEQE